MFSFLRGTYCQTASAEAGVVTLDVGGVGYEVFVPPVVEQEIISTLEDGAPLLLYVSAVSSRDQPWPVLFGFLRPEEKALWELLRTVPRIGGKGAARALAVPVHELARAIEAHDIARLDDLPGVTRDGAERIATALRNKVGRFLQGVPGRSPVAVSQAGSAVREEALQALVQMGVPRLDAQRAIDQILASGDADPVEAQQIIVTYLRTYA